MMEPQPPSTLVINEYAYVEQLGPQEFDKALANGWRHFGEYFFRYSEMLTEQNQKLTIQPLRLTVADFLISKSQRRVLRKNADISLRIGPTRLYPELEAMFHAHKDRFECNVPGKLADFLGDVPGQVVPNLSFMAYVGKKLVGVSFLDVGKTATSSVYAMFDPEESRRSLGHYTMLAEIHWCQQQSYTHYYPGYGSVEPSVYDYKKTIRPLEQLHWPDSTWVPLDET